MWDVKRRAGEGRENGIGGRLIQAPQDIPVHRQEVWPVPLASRRWSRSRLAAIRQVLAHSPPSRRSPVPRSRALWPVGPVS